MLYDGMLSDSQNRLIHLSDLTKKAKMLTIKVYYLERGEHDVVRKSWH